MNRNPLSVLFLCTGNSCRSQMAEGIARHLGGGKVHAFSAGTSPKGLHPLSVKAMQEIGIDISSQQSKHLDAFSGQSFDFAVTVCDRAKESCPIWPGATRIHWTFDDPAEATGSEEEQLVVFRRVRDEIRRRVAPLVQAHLTLASVPRNPAVRRDRMPRALFWKERWPEFERVLTWLMSLKGARIHVLQQVSLRPDTFLDRHWTSSTSFRTNLELVATPISGLKLTLDGSDGARCEVFLNELEHFELLDGEALLVERPGNVIGRVTTIRLLEPRGDR